jgi:geranylgeranyl diphosphate synthase type I
MRCTDLEGFKSNPIGDIVQLSDHPLSPAMLKAIESDLQTAASLPVSMQSHPIKAMIDHHMGWMEGQKPSGKRIRPLLTLLTCHATGGEWQTALPAASAIEIIHNFSLIHDDIEDDSETRRGRPTIWKLWGVPQAINTGDALFALARSSTKRLVKHGCSPKTAMEVEGKLDRALLSLTFGQHLDLNFETQDSVSIESYLEMIEGKTAALLEAATSIGGVLSGRPPEQIEQLALFGKHLGLAFQITDDILGIWGDPEVTGKPSGDDLLIGKKTLPVIFGLERSVEFNSLWSKPDGRRESLEKMSTLLAECGAKSYAKDQADEHTRLALHSLTNLIPKEATSQELYALADRLLTRQH